MDLTLLGPVWEPTGYAELNRALIRALAKQGVRLSVKPFSWPFPRPELDPETRTLLEEVQKTELQSGPVLYSFLPETFAKWPGRFSIGLTMFEADRIPSLWVEACNRMDEIWVPTAFNMETFAASGVRPEKLRLMPLGVDTDRFRPSLPPLFLARRRGFTFLTNFQWGPRKGQEVLLRAYVEEFSPREEVTLLIKTFQSFPGYDPRAPFLRQEVRTILASSGKKDLPNIVFIAEILPAYMMPRLYASADCYINTAYGEGWDMPALEAMASGLPVIATAWGAHLDYLDAGNGYLLAIDGLVPADHPHPFYHGARWARPSLKEARRLMRHVFLHREEAKTKGRRARETVLSRYSWEIAARRMLEALEGVSA